MLNAFATAWLRFVIAAASSRDSIAPILDCDLYSKLSISEIQKILLEVNHHADA